MRRRRTSGSSGYALIIVTIIVFVVMAVTAVGLADEFVKTSANNTDTSALLRRLHEAIIGAPDRNFFGYLGDVGDYPVRLTDLLEDPGGSVVGWKGPYLANVDVTSGMILDPYLSPLEYYLDGTPGTSHKLSIISRGPDHSSTNTAANPNVASDFTPVFPSSGSYAAGAGNADNIGSVDFMTSVNNLDYSNIGSLKVQLLNDELFRTPGVVDVCPGQYFLDIRSETRGSSDRLNIPADRMTLSLLQGVWDVRATSILRQKEAFAAKLTVLPGTFFTQQVRLPQNDASQAPTVTTTVTNTFGVTITVTRNGGSSFNVGAGATVANANISCPLMEAKTGGAGGTTQYSWISRYGVNQSVVVSPTSSTLTVTNNAGGYRQLVVWVHGPSLAAANTLGNVYDREVRSFTIMNGNTVWISDGTGTQLDTFVVNGATAKAY